jgi:hypothetical protein
MDDANRSVAVGLPFDGTVRIEVYDEAGGLRGLLFDGRLTSGSHSIGLSAMGLNSGTYFLRMTAGNEKESYTATCSVTIIK